MKKKNKRLITIVGLLLIVVVGATFAYFQSNASFENLFATGTYRIVTTEVFESPDNWAPGQEIPKTITSTNEGTIPAAVRASITEQWLKEIDGVETDITNQVENGTVIINFANTNDWTHVGNYYYYNYILNPNETTTSFIESVTLNPNINGATCVASQDGLTQTCESNNPALGATYKLTITKETVQADKYQEIWNTNVNIIEKPSAITYLTRQVEGQITPGDVVGIGETEDFYVLSSDNSENGKTVLLAKYNILVGKTSGEELNSAATEGYGLQSVDAIGYFYGECISVIGFANNLYWMNNEQIDPKYSNDNAIYYDAEEYEFKYRSDDSIVYPYVYDENSTIYPYISGEDGYINRLKNMGAPSSITGRLLSYEEVEAYQSIEYEGNSIIYNNTNYWLGSASGGNIIGEFKNGITADGPSNAAWFGVRPVIEIPTSELS